MLAECRRILSYFLEDLKHLFREICWEIWTKNKRCVMIGVQPTIKYSANSDACGMPEFVIL